MFINITISPLYSIQINYMVGSDKLTISNTYTQHKAEIFGSLNNTTYDYSK